MTLQNHLDQRCQSKCELCTANAPLSIYVVPPATAPTLESAVMLCAQCQEQIKDQTDAKHWHCLSETMWSEHPVIQVMAWRILSRLTDQAWAQDLLSQLYLDDETLKWAQADKASAPTQNELEDPVVKDSNGNILVDGDSVTLIKDLEVKGAGFTAKRGTIVKNISLTANPAHIEGRVNGAQIVLLTCFLKKAN